MNGYDLDILIEATIENTRNLLAALKDAGLGTSALTTAEEVLSDEITVFEDRVRIDVQTSMPGLAFGDAWERRTMMEYRGQAFQVVSKEDLIVSKRAAGRSVDMEEVRLLQATEGPTPE